MAFQIESTHSSMNPFGPQVDNNSYMDFSMMEQEILLTEKLVMVNKVLDALRSEKYLDEAEMK